MELLVIALPAGATASAATWAAMRVPMRRLLDLKAAPVALKIVTADPLGRVQGKLQAAELMPPAPATGAGRTSAGAAG
jgi:hypothetical protein